MGISILGNNDSSYELLKKGIDAANTRSKVISNNLANINTANYKKFNVVFEDTLKSNGGSISLKNTKQGHLSTENKEGNISVVQDKSTSMREDGNNIDLDVEKVNQAANQMKYNALIQQASSKISNMKYVIGGGN